ncbi:hypothetical protein P7L95_09920 [Bisgaard Taxon 10/6]|uniref:LPD7 domain-containing protein n=1 Tax=Exercitatus varius TaxID=67857 RepID=UPI00294B8745|nr:LPD7 domain-containing protein [Exercitatus varius]MDG2957058.1 hypothetical protein [Exercitatus varius]MDG2965254.1 hypothetical protein [Exercitatus varius]
MIAEISGGNNGIAEYLEKGFKQGRLFSRDELDNRIVLDGDLELTNKIINSIVDKGQQRYLHITLSFRENEVSQELLESVVTDYKQLLLSAYSDDEYNFYAEAHLPKIKSIQDSKTGKMVERKPHIHIAIPEINLLTGNKLLPTGYIDDKNIKNLIYLDSIQEYINYKYNLDSPKDFSRGGGHHSANVLSRIKGDFFGEKQSEFKAKLVDEIAAGKINSLSEFQSYLSNIGEVKIRNKGKDNQYFAVKLNDDKKFTNLKHPIFSEQAIITKALPKADKATINARVKEWQDRVSKEIKFVDFATQSFRQKYAQADLAEKQQLLAEREQNYERKYRHRNFHESGRQRNYQSNLANTQKRKSSAASRYAVGVSGLSIGNVVYGENQDHNGTQGILPENELNHLRNRQAGNDSTLRCNDSSRTSDDGAGKRRDRRIISSSEQSSRGASRGTIESQASTRTNRGELYTGRADIWGRHSGVYQRGYDNAISAKKSHYALVSRGLPTQSYNRTLFNKEEYYAPIKTPFEAYEENLAQKNSKIILFSDSNALSQLVRTQSNEQAYRSDIERFREIRQRIDPDAFLSHLERIYSINPKKHRVSYAKDGSPRFSVNKRNLNASDFLTKYLNLEWKEAKSVLSYIYEQQANKNVNQEKLTSLEIQRNIKSFDFEVRQFEKDVKLALHNLNVDNRNLYRGEKKRIYSRFSHPRIRNQELAIASFRAMQRQERIDYFAKFTSHTLEREKFTFQQSGYTTKALEDSTMAFKDSLNIALGNEFGRIASADEQISFSDNFKQQQILLKRQLQEQQRSKAAETSKQETPQRAFTSKALEEVMKLNNLGVAKKENGDIEYKRLSDGKTVCTDVGNQMLISKEMQSPENIKTFLELAIDKYGNELKINGSKEFKEMVIESAAANNLPIILKPAALQEQLMERRKELELEAKVEYLDSVSNEAGQQLKADVSQTEAQQQSPETQVDVPQTEAQQQSPEAQADVPQAEVQQQAPDKQHSNGVQKTYDIKFEFKRDEKAANGLFKIKVNGVTVATAIKKDPNTLEVLKNHPNLKGLSDSQIKKGIIEDNGILRPMDMKLDAKGNEIQEVKSQEQAFER